MLTAGWWHGTLPQANALPRISRLHTQAAYCGVCGVPSAECRVPSAESRVPSAESRVPSPECRVPSAECRVPR
jgi:hypothetical protein